MPDQLQMFVCLASPRLGESVLPARRLAHVFLRTYILVVGLCVLVFVTCRIVRESMRFARPLPRESVRVASS